MPFVESTVPERGKEIELLLVDWKNNVVLRLEARMSDVIAMPETDWEYRMFIERQLSSPEDRLIMAGEQIYAASGKEFRHWAK